MEKLNRNRFQTFFEEDKYIALKNDLYNYLLRKRAIEKNIRSNEIKLILEIGSGISPVITRTKRIIYSDLSFTALRILRKKYLNGWHVVADAMNLPFKAKVFSHTICSEVLEHLEDDIKALNELSRVMKPSGQLVVSFPHRKCLFAIDDHYVNHFRRYEVGEIKSLLYAAGFKSLHVQKVLGPLDKLTMMVVVFSFWILQRMGKIGVKKTPKYNLLNVFISFVIWFNRIYMGIVWLDAKIMPRAFSSVLMIKAQRNPRLG